MENQSSFDALEYNKMVSFIWSVANECLRDNYKRGKYRDVIIPMTVLRRFDTIIEAKKVKILNSIEQAKKYNWGIDETLETALEIPFYNISEYSLKDLTSITNVQTLKETFKSYLDGYSDNVKEILQKFDFINHIDKMADAGILGLVIQKFVSEEINLSPYDIYDDEGKIIKRGLDNHAMGTLFEEIIRKFNEENNEEAGEHFTPRDVIEFMADIAMIPVIDKIKDGTYSIYDGACGTLGMGTVAEEKFRNFAKMTGKNLSIHIIGQEVNPETYAISKADLLIKGGDTASNNVHFGSTLSDDKTSGEHFDFMLSNPPYGKNWRSDLVILGDGGEKDSDADLKKKIKDSRFLRNYKEDKDFRMLPDVDDGQILFLLNNVSKMKDTELGSRIVEVHNGSALFTGDANSGASNARRFIIEEDLLEAIIRLPDNMFYNTGLTTYIWVLSNRKEEYRKRKIQLIDACKIKSSLRKNMGEKNCELSNKDRLEILNLYLDFKENRFSRIFDNDEFGYYKITVERPLRLSIQCNAIEIKRIEKECIKIGVMEGTVNKKNMSDSFAKKTAAAIAELSKKENMQAYLSVLKELECADKYMDYVLFEKKFNTCLSKYNKQGSLAKLQSTGLLSYMIIKDENAEIIKNSKGVIIADSELRDTENVPMNYGGGIEQFMKDEVLPYKKDAFVDYKKTQVGYEISFTKYFYEAKKLDSVSSLVSKLKALEIESNSLRESILEEFNEEI